MIPKLRNENAPLDYCEINPGSPLIVRQGGKKRPGYVLDSIPVPDRVDAYRHAGDCTRCLIPVPVRLHHIQPESKN